MPLPSSTIDAQAEEIFEKIRAYAPNANLEKIRNAYEFAKRAHQGQLRKSGEPYIVHPIGTVQILTNLHVDEDTIVAAFIHDVPEDTPVGLEEIKRAFGEKTAYLVDGITKLSKVQYREKMEQRHIESLKKLFIHSAEDLRVILIKLADRMDNMRTLRFISDWKKRARIARETLEIYVPIANLLGIGELRAEMEDLSLEYIYPSEFLNLKREVEENMEERNFILEEMIRMTEKELNKNNIESEIIGRPKTLYSIFKKLQTKQTIYHIDDLIAIRIVAPTRKDCYQILGIIHRLFKPKTGRVKDYIAVPKPNGYQSLHTTVFGLHGSIVEFQIRTRYMHLEAEYGIAAHYFYKYSNEQELTKIMKQRASWVQRILEIQKDNKDTDNFLENLKLDIFQDRIFVFTPKGDVIDLPRGASALDFAYAIHTEIGNHAAKAEINGAISPVTVSLSTGDTVSITTKKEIEPELEWLHFVKTSLALHKIKERLKCESIEKKLLTGKKFLQKEFDRIGRNFIEELSQKHIQVIAKKLPYKNLDEILIAVGEGNLDPKNILNILYEENQLSARGKRYFIKKLNTRKPGFLSHIGLKIIGDNSKNQFREIIRTLNSLKIPIVKFIVEKLWYMSKHKCRLTVMVQNYNELAQIFESLEQLEGIEKVSRVFLGRKILFITSTIITAGLWISHPFLLQIMLTHFAEVKIISHIILYIGIILLFGLVFYIKRMARRSFPELAETGYFWSLLYLLNTLALFTTIGEIFVLEVDANWLLILVFIASVYAMLTANYIAYKKEQFQ